MQPHFDQRNRLLALFEQSTFPSDAFNLDAAFQGRQIFVYGAGESYHYFKEGVERRHGYKACAILDRKFKPGDTFDGLPAQAPETFKLRAVDRTSALAVICLSPVSPYLGEARTALQGMGFTRILSLQDIYEIQNPFGEPEGLGNKGFAFYQEAKEQILEAFDLMADELSREIFLACAAIHMTRRGHLIPCQPRLEQYRPTDVPLKKGFARSIHGGMSAGDIPWLFRAKGPLKELLILEPDETQFDKLQTHLTQDAAAVAGQLTLLPLALHDAEAVLPFLASDTSFGARIHPQGQRQVQCACLDHLLPGGSTDFLGLDIEGVELKALHGAKQLLTRCRPDLGICVYHSPDQLWEIPIFLHGLVPEYRFYLRNYTGLTGETVLYATA